MTAQAQPPPVVAGWSGSAVSERALDVAAGFAERRHVPLYVVLGWDYIDQPFEDYDPSLSPADVDAVLAGAVARVRAAHPDVDVTSRAELGWASRVICEAAEGADLLVLGRSEGKVGFFSDWAPDKIVRHVPCPVVFVP